MCCFVWTWTFLDFHSTQTAEVSASISFLIYHGWHWVVKFSLGPEWLLHSMHGNMIREFSSQRQIWGAPWGKPLNVHNSKFMAKMWHFRGKQIWEQTLAKTGLGGNMFQQLKYKRNCSQLWPWNMMVFRIISVERKGWVPHCLPWSSQSCCSNRPELVERGRCRGVGGGRR